jgi:hypothetical protein
MLQANPPHLLKLGLAQGLGQNVGGLISSGNVVGLDASFFQTLSDEVVLGPDVLASVMQDRILCQGKGRLAVHL